MLEWGLNWCITAYSQHILVIHAACVARGPRRHPTGRRYQGKSTLCAALANRGWRLLSDKLTLIRLDTGGSWALAGRWFLRTPPSTSSAPPAPRGPSSPAGALTPPRAPSR